MAIPVHADTTYDGTLVYNGYDFTNYRKMQLAGTPVYDEAERVVTHVSYTLAVQFLVFGSSESDCSTQVEELRGKLMVEGQQLTVTALGLGLWDTQSASAINRPELIWGPKPRSINFRPVGGTLAYLVEWVVEFHISECSNLASGFDTSFPQWMALNYSATYESDEKGVGSRNLNGYILLPRTRDNPVVNIDLVWDRAKFPVPFGWRRTRSSHTLNNARNRIEFQIADREVDHDSFPPDMVNGSGEFSVGNIEPSNFLQWSARLSVSLEVRHDRPITLAGQRFVQMYLDREQEIRSSISSLEKGVVIPSRFFVSRGLFRHTMRFEAEWLITACLKDIFGKTGLWRPVPGSNYSLWAASMADVWHNRGLAKIVHNDDAIVSLCGGTISDVTIGETTSQHPEPTDSFSQSLNCVGVTQDNSWIYYQNRIRIASSENAKLHKLSTAVSPGAVQDSSWLGRQWEGVKDLLEFHSAPDHYIIMQGRALRYKFPIGAGEIPDLVSIGGVPVKHVDTELDLNGVIAVIFDCPIFATRWARLYKADTYIPSAKLPPQKDKCLDLPEIGTEGVL